MITKEILKAQLDLYIEGRKHALEAFEKAKADVSAFNGAIEACESLIKLEEELANTEESSEVEKNKEDTNGTNEVNG